MLSATRKQLNDLKTQAEMGPRAFLAAYAPKTALAPGLEHLVATALIPEPRSGRTPIRGEVASQARAEASRLLF